MHARVATDRLRDLQTVTDAALAFLPLEELLRELLIRVVEILEVDTAAVLLLDDDGSTLVARAARGLEEEVERGVRIPVGRGFAGRIAATKEPVWITRLEEAEVLNPILRERGLTSLLGVPLMVEGAVIGVLHVGSLRLRRFSEDDVEVLQRAGDRAALAIHSLVAERERGLADALQRSLIPKLPDLPGVGLAGRYLPAASAKVGGDWYDAFPLAGGRLGMAIGDVVGRGFQAAALMGQLRSGLRAYSMQGLPPREVMEQLSHLLRQLEPGRSATLLYLVADPHRGELTISGAGHPPPVVAQPSGGASVVELPGSVPLGAVRYPRYEQLDLALEPGSTLVLVTDGVVERPNVSIDAGLERLREVVATSNRDPQALCHAILAAMLPRGTALDDAALLAMRALPLSDPLSVRLPAEVESIPFLRRLLGRWLGEAGAAAAEVEDLSLACSEACANAIEHAYSPAPGALEVRATVSEAGSVTVTVRDFGTWRERRGDEGGRGMILMEGLTDSLELIRGQGGTTVELTRRLEARTP